MNSLRRYLSTRHPRFAGALAIVIALFVVLVERYAGGGGSFWVLLLVPTAIATWYAGWIWGVAVALIGVALSVLPVAGAGAAAVPISELAVRVALLLGLVYVLRESRRAAGGQEEMVRTDPSTGLANARALFDLVAAEVVRAQRYRRPFTLAYVSIENLPTIAQRAGHSAAELVLQRIAREIRGSLRGSDQVARLRDREFALLLPETGPEAAAIVLGRMRELLVAQFAAEPPHGVSFVIGALTWLRSELTVDELHQRTYQLMYSARQENVQVRHEVLGTADDATFEPASRRRGA